MSKGGHMEYEDIGGIRWSRLKSMRVSPLQYRYDVEHPREETVHLRLGLAIHCLVLEPHAWEQNFAVFTGAKDRRSKAYKEWAAEQPDNKTLLTWPERDRAMKAADAVLADRVASPYLRGGAAEHVITWKDEVTGIVCKARVDRVDGRLVELKSTHDVIPRKFAVLAERMGYHAQISFYLDGLRANGLAVEGDPALIVCQSDEPIDVVTYMVREDVVRVGRDEYRRLLKRLAECRKSDYWPGVADGAELEFVLPAWAYTHDDEDDQPLTMGGAMMTF